MEGGLETRGGLCSTLVDGIAVIDAKTPRAWGRVLARDICKGHAKAMAIALPGDSGWFMAKVRTGCQERSGLLCGVVVEVSVAFVSFQGLLSGPFELSFFLAPAEDDGDGGGRRVAEQGLFFDGVPVFG